MRFQGEEAKAREQNWIKEGCLHPRKPGQLHGHPRLGGLGGGGGSLGRGQKGSWKHGAEHCTAGVCLFPSPLVLLSRMRGGGWPGNLGLNLARNDIGEEGRAGHTQGELPSGRLQDLGRRKKIKVHGTTG